MPQSYNNNFEIANKNDKTMMQGENFFYAFLFFVAQTK
jgi:hypothetical protein